MNKYEILVHFDDNSSLTFSTEYAKIYELQTVISGFGKNGVWDTENNTYYPAHRIQKIEITLKKQ